ncbi:IS66 family insertion sequence element accessory protein TnpA [Algoriphagus persicinus]|uniref:IS66 family insertion sequence element accessory protein TnpA n=1 Tax=Algoriphagus persicinus TaxID=3108754 RepID=UPI002B3C9BEA|nr:IS66 family insertion sequence element accessory protein TnpB [Algoriphagus sp. E1-3-M2]MEB2787309.1 IS66 family insertion sequence element accessory protein TnpB [Algoriphagus sp. E1-3-M2]
MKRASQKEMEAAVASFKSSGLTQREFCLQENIKPPTCSYWYRKVGAECPTSTLGFTEVTAPVQSGGLEVVYPNGVTVRGIHDLSLLQLLVNL